MKKKWIIFIILLLVLAAVAAAAVLFFRKGKGDQGAPGEVLQAYMDKILEKDYQGMYGLLDEESRNLWSLEEFTERNQKIYEGIGLSGMEITFSEQGEDEARVDYKTAMETEVGSIQFQNYARFSREEEGWRLQWNDGLIFPDLTASDTVRVEETAASRGSIYDRNGGLLAGSGAVSSVGLVPGKYQEENGERLAALLEITVEDIQAALEQSWVTEDTFVPLKKIRLGEDNESLEQQLLEIPGVMITEDEDRVYPLGEKAGLLVGYIQEVTAEDLEKHPDAGYVTGSRIGRAGLEALYEDRLRGTSGCRIYIEDENGEEKEILADTGYGQGEMLVNPLHLASIYSAFSNGGDMILPVLEYQEGSAPQYWLQDVFPEQAVDTVREDLIQVIENPEGTGAAARVEGAALAGKTGTAEIKDSQSDTEGTELGWFNVFTTDLPEDRAFLLVSMVEDVKDRGGSGYVIDRSRDLLSSYLADSAF